MPSFNNKIQNVKYKRYHLMYGYLINILKHKIYHWTGQPSMLHIYRILIMYCYVMMTYSLLGVVIPESC